MELSKSEYEFLNVFPRDKTLLRRDPDILEKIKSLGMNGKDANEYLTNLRRCLHQDREQTMTFALNDYGLRLMNEYEAAFAKEEKENKLQVRINELTETNLRLQNRELKYKVLFAAIGGVLGFVGANYKATIQLVQELFQKVFR